MLLTDSSSRQISDGRHDMQQRALFVTSRAAWRWNKMLRAPKNVGRPLAAIVVATEHKARCASGCQLLADPMIMPRTTT